MHEMFVRAMNQRRKRLDTTWWLGYAFSYIRKGSKKKKSFSGVMKTSRCMTWTILISFLGLGMLGSPVPAWCIGADGYIVVASGLSCVGKSGGRGCHSEPSSECGYEESHRCLHVPAFTVGSGSHHFREDTNFGPSPAWVSTAFAEASRFPHIPGKGFAKNPLHSPGLTMLDCSVVLLL